MRRKGKNLALGALASVSALALPVAIASSAAIAAKVIAEPSALSVIPLQEAEALLEIGRRMPELLKEFWDASAALKDAQARFDESAPLPPKPRKRAKDQAKRMFERPLIKIVRGAPAPSSTEVNPSHAYESLWDAMLRGENELTRKEIYQVSDRYQWKLFSAARDRGLAAALTRFRKARHELREVAAQAFEFKPGTRLGIAAQALALIGASEAQDGRVGSKFAGLLAINLIEIDNRLDPDQLAVIASPRAPLGQPA